MFSQINSIATNAFKLFCVSKETILFVNNKVFCYYGKQTVVMSGIHQGLILPLTQFIGDYSMDK